MWKSLQTFCLAMRWLSRSTAARSTRGSGGSSRASYAFSSTCLRACGLAGAMEMVFSVTPALPTAAQDDDEAGAVGVVKAVSVAGFARLLFGVLTVALGDEAGELGISAGFADGALLVEGVEVGELAAVVLFGVVDCCKPGRGAISPYEGEWTDDTGVRESEAKKGSVDTTVSLSGNGSDLNTVGNCVVVNFKALKPGCGAVVSKRVIREAAEVSCL